MRVVVDYDRCESHGICMATAPDIFEVGDDDKMRILRPELPDGLTTEVERAVTQCPKQALSLEPAT